MYSLKTNSSFDSAHFLAGYDAEICTDTVGRLKLKSAARS